MALMMPFEDTVATDGAEDSKERALCFLNFPFGRTSFAFKLRVLPFFKTAFAFAAFTADGFTYFPPEVAMCNVFEAERIDLPAPLVWYATTMYL